MDSANLCVCRLEFADSAYNCYVLLLRNPLVMFSCYGIRDKPNVPTKLTLQVFVRGIHRNVIGGIHLGIFWNTDLQFESKLFKNVFDLKFLYDSELLPDNWYFLTVLDRI